MNDRIYYRTGKFTTTLTGPELLQLRSEGKVRRVHAVALYELGRPFQGVAGALIGLRTQARDLGDSAWELFAKTLGTGLGGKLAQKKGTWDAVKGVVPPYPWGEWIEAQARGRQPVRWRAIAGIAFRFRPDETGDGPFTAAFSYLTAYGRLHMRGLRDEAGRTSVVTQDTDGIGVLADCPLLATRTGSGGGVGAGTLREKDRWSAARFLSAKHYWTPDGWVLSGFNSPGPVSEDFAVSDTQKHDGAGMVSTTPPDGVFVRLRTSRLKIESHGMRIGKDGWASETTRH